MTVNEGTGPAVLNRRTGVTAELARTVTWRTAVLLALGTALLVTVSLGPMAAEVGNVSVLIWFVTAVIGALQCLMIISLARLYPSQAGGTATYAHIALSGVSPYLAGLSSWAYWFAWTPGIAVNAILASNYLGAALDIDAGIPVAVALVALLYGLNYFGLKASTGLYTVVAVFAIVPLTLILVGALAHPSKLHMGNVLPLSVPGHALLSGAAVALVLKWAFVGAWSSYGAEMASTVVAEMRDPDTRVGRAMRISAIAGVVAFTIVPLVLFALVGAKGLEEDALVVFLDPAKELFGDAGSRVVAIMLAAALLLGAQAFIVGSSRTIFQMAKDGHMPAVFGKVNRHGVPVGSITWDVLVILTLVAIFGEGIVDLVASANIGYIVVFVLLPLTYLSVERQRGKIRSAADLRRPRHALAIVLAIVNLILLLGGGPQWGWTVVLTGVIVLSLIVPLTLISRRQFAHGRHPLVAVPAPRRPPGDGPRAAGDQEPA